jgi:NAD(P)-dependent dehydrogenase (short-subunit alcohol dehydrogenase family)
MLVSCVPDVPAAHHLPTLDLADACMGLVDRARRALDDGHSRLVLVTQGAQAAGTNHRMALVQAGLWGAARVLRNEYPGLALDLIDLDPAKPGAAQHDDLRAALSSGVPQAALRGGTLLVPALEPLPACDASPSVDAEALYLVTGGFGALGLRTASWLFDLGARHLLLVGRSGPADEAVERLDALRTCGASITECRVDVADAAAERRLDSEIAATGRKLAGIVHASGILADGVALNLTRSKFDDVLAPKVAGGQMIDRLATRHAVQWLVFYSSVASLEGPSGQANYAAANAFLDALAHDRRARGLPALSVNWGPWAEAGMAARHPQAAAALGLAPMAPAAALQALGAGLGHGLAQIEIAQRGAPRTRKPAIGIVPAIAGSTPHDVEALVRIRLAEALGLSDANAIERRARLFDLGLDSLSALEVRDALSMALDRPLHATLLFDHPTVEALVRHLTQDGAREPPAAGTVGESAIERLTEEEAELALLRALKRLDQ